MPNSRRDSMRGEQSTKRRDREWSGCSGGSIPCPRELGFQTETERKVGKKETKPGLPYSTQAGDGHEKRVLIGEIWRSLKAWRRGKETTKRSQGSPDQKSGEKSLGKKKLERDHLLRGRGDSRIKRKSGTRRRRGTWHEEGNEPLSPKAPRRR